MRAKHTEGQAAESLGPISENLSKTEFPSERYHNWTKDLIGRGRDRMAQVPRFARKGEQVFEYAKQNAEQKYTLKKLADGLWWTLLTNSRKCRSAGLRTRILLCVYSRLQWTSQRIIGDGNIPPRPSWSADCCLRQLGRTQMLLPSDIQCIVDNPIMVSSSNSREPNNNNT